MIGTHPTVGCLVFLRMGSPQTAIRRVLAALDTLVKDNGREDQRRLIRASIGDEQAEGLIFAQPGNEDRSTVVFVEFDEEATALLAERRGKSLDVLLLPFVMACEKVAEAGAVGIGFEASVPEGFDDHSLKSAGIAVLFERDKAGMTWSRRDIFRLTAHTERSLAHA